MRTRTLLLTLLFANATGAQAQGHSLDIQAALITSLTGRAASAGFGLSLRGALAIRAHSDITGTIAFHRVSETGGGMTERIRLLSLQAGYRQHIGAWEIEPQVGIGVLGSKTPIAEGGDYARNSVAALVAGLQAGVRIKRLYAGVSFQWAGGIEGAAAGTGHDRRLPFAGATVGYRLSGK
jgi:hypothetical protein